MCSIVLSVTTTTSPLPFDYESVMTLSFSLVTIHWTPWCNCLMNTHYVIILYNILHPWTTRYYSIARDTKKLSLSLFLSLSFFVSLSFSLSLSLSEQVCLSEKGGGNRSYSYSNCSQWEQQDTKDQVQKVTMGPGYRGRDLKGALFSFMRVDRYHGNVTTVAVTLPR